MRLAASIREGTVAPSVILRKLTAYRRQNKGETRHALADTIYTNRRGRFADRTIENQQNRTSGLNLIIAAIAYWNTLYLERAADHLRYSAHQFDERSLSDASPMGWTHIGLTGDYLWGNASAPRRDRYRPPHDPSARSQLVA